MISIEDEMGVMSKIRGEILAGLQRQRKEQYEKEIRLVMQTTLMDEEEKIIFLTNQINLRAARKALEDENNVSVQTDPEP